MRYWVTRARRDWIPGQPHPGYDEYENGVPTGQISGAGMTTQVDSPIVDAQVADALAVIAPPAPVEPPQRLADLLLGWGSEQLEGLDAVPLTSGLKRDLRTDQRLRDEIAKFDRGGTLNDKELRRLLQFYGILIRMTEIVGQSYYLIQQDVLSRHQRLTQMAADRGWTPGLMSMYGVMVEDVLGRIC